MRKAKSWIIATTLAALLFAGICMAPLFAHVTRADTASDLQAQINSQNAAISSLDAEIAGYQSQLSQIGANKNTLTNAIKSLTVTANKLKADIQLTQAKIDANNLQIQSLGDSITKDSASMQDLDTAVAQSLREENEQDNQSSFTSLIASGGTFADLWQTESQQVQFRDGLRDKVSELASTKVALAASQTQVAQAQGALVSLASQLQDQKTINQKTVNDKTALLTQTKGQEAAYQKLLANKVALKAQMESDERDYEAKLKYVLDPSSLPPAGSSPLSWPIDTAQYPVLITQLFGKTSSSGRLYSNGTHNGVDFGMPIGTPVDAMANGVIVGSGNTDLTCPKASYGRWLYIKYDNGLSSLYGHLSLIKPSMTAGTRVETGSVVAYSGETGYATGPHLHVTIIAASAGSIQSFPSAACNGKNYTAPVAALNAYLDPMVYLPKPTAAELKYAG